MTKDKSAVCFIAVEAIVYIAFFIADLFQAYAFADVLKYASILLCLIYALIRTAGGGERMIPLALAFTAAADSLLLVAQRGYALGILFFLVVQGLYAVRLRMDDRRSVAWRIGLALFFWGVLSLCKLAQGINLLAALYFSQLLCNVALAWRGRRDRLFALGLTLFAACDICVGLRNVPELLPDLLFTLVCFGMWAFYLPSQVLITLSAKPKSEVQKNAGK